MHENRIYGINGPVVTVKGRTSLEMMEMVYVGESRLVGEVIGITDEATTIQVYEETGGLRPGEPVFSTGSPMCVTLGPGLLTNIFDGIERPLSEIAKGSGGKIDYDDPQFRMLMASSVESPLRSMQISGGMKGGVLPGISGMCPARLRRH